jgi:hypothetical protein
MSTFPRPEGHPAGLVEEGVPMLAERSSAPERRRDDREFRKLGVVGLALLGLFNAADLLTTSRALRSGRATELNPTGRFLLHTGTAGLAKSIILLLVGFLLVRYRPRPFTMAFIWFMTGLYAMVVASNIIVAVRA